MKLHEISELVGYNYKLVGNIILKYFKEGLEGVLGENRKEGRWKNGVTRIALCQHRLHEHIFKRSIGSIS